MSKSIVFMMLLAVIAGCSESTNAETGSNGSTSVDASGTATADANDGTDAMLADTARSTTDSAPPSWPVDASLEVLTQGVTHVVLSWTEASDESGISAYLILKDGEEVAKVDRSTTVFKVEGLTEKTTCSFRVEAEDTAGNRSDDGPQTTITLADVTAPELPADLLIEAMNIGPTELTIQWSGELPTDESLTWRIWLDFQEIADLDSSTTEYTFESLVPLTSYTVQLGLVDEAGNESALSEPLVVQTGDDAAPLWPDGSQLEATNIEESTLTLTWPNATDADSIAQYLVSQDSEAIHTLNQDLTTVEVTDLTPWTDYVFDVIAVDPSGLQSIPLELTVQTADNTPPMWPEKSLELVVDTDAITLNWSAAEDLGGLVGYRVYRDNLLMGETDASIQTLLVPDVPTGVELSWRVEAFDAAGNESTNGPDAGGTVQDVAGPIWPPTAEIKLFDVTTNAAVVTWDTAIDTGGIASYDISVNGALHKTVAASTNLTSVTGLSPASQVTVSIVAHDLAGNVSPESISLTFTTGAPGVPTWPVSSTLEALSITPDTVTLSWSMPNNDVEVASFHVYGDDALVATVPYSAAAALIENVIPDSTAVFRVEAVGLTGLESTTGPSVTVTTPPVQAPHWSDSALLFATAESETTVSLFWTGAPSEVATYHVYLDGEETLVVDAPASGTTLLSLDATTTYTIRVEAAGPEGLQSVNGPETVVTTLDETPPTFPAGAVLSIGAIGQTSAELSWTTAADTGGVVAYRIVNTANAEILLTVPGDTTGIQLTGLYPESLYSVQVQAGDSSGNWSPSGPLATFETLEFTTTVGVGGVYTALEPHCGTCHFSEFNTQGSFEQTFASDPVVVVPGDPDASKLIQYLEGTYPGNKSQMPPYGPSYEELVTSGDAALPVSAIRDWIEAME